MNVMLTSRTRTRIASAMRQMKMTMVNGKNQFPELDSAQLGGARILYLLGESTNGAGV